MQCECDNALPNLKCVPEPFFHRKITAPTYNECTDRTLTVGSWGERAWGRRLVTCPIMPMLWKWTLGYKWNRLSLSHSNSVFLSVSLYRPISYSVRLSLSVSTCLSLSVSVCLSLPVCLSLSACLSQWSIRFDRLIKNRPSDSFLVNQFSPSQWKSESPLSCTRGWPSAERKDSHKAELIAFSDSWLQANGRETRCKHGHNYIRRPVRRPTHGNLGPCMHDVFNYY